MTSAERVFYAVAVFSLSGCGSKTAESAVTEQARATGDIVLDSASPKLAAIGVDTARTTHDHTVAMLPAQVVLDEDHTVRVFSPVTGRIRELLAAPGDRVAAGGSLATITSSDMAQAASDQAKAAAALAQASAALTRAEDLYAHKVIALKDLEQARSDAAQAAAENDRAAQRTAQLGGSSGVRGDFILRSPIGGDVIDRTANPGAEVRPDATAPLFTVSSLDTLWIVAAAPQRDLGQLRVGSTLVFATDAAPGRAFSARVTYVADQLDPVTRTTQVRAAIVNVDRGLRAMVAGVARLMAPAGAARVVVPTRALVTSGTEVVVFVQKGRGRFERRPVIVDDDDGTTATIREGIKPGERVVTRGSVLLAAEAERLP